MGLLTLLTAVAAAAPARSPLTPDRLPCPLVSEAPGEVRVLANRPFALTDTVVLTAR